MKLITSGYTEQPSFDDVLDATTKPLIAEIERLNAQVAMLRESLEEASRNENYPPFAIAKFNTTLLCTAESVTDWLTTHDQQVRDKALEDAACKEEDTKTEVENNV